MSATTVAGYGSISAGKIVVPDEIRFMGATGNNTLHHTIELENTAMTRTFKYNLPNITNVQVDGVDGLNVSSEVDKARLLISGVQNVFEDELGDEAVTEDKIHENAVTTDKIADDAVTADKIADNAVESSHISDSAVSSGKLADSAVIAGKIDDGAVTEDKLASDAVTSAKIASGAVVADALASDSVQTDKIEDAAVTNDKIASGISSSKISGYGEFDGSDIELRQADGTKKWKISLSGNNLEFAYWNGSAYVAKQLFES